MNLNIIVYQLTVSFTIQYYMYMCVYISKWNHCSVDRPCHLQYELEHPNIQCTSFDTCWEEGCKHFNTLVAVSSHACANAH